METMIGKTSTTASTTKCSNNFSTTTASTGTTATTVVTNTNTTSTNRSSSTASSGRLTNGETCKEDKHRSEERIDSDEQGGTSSARKSSSSSQAPVPNFRVVGNDGDGDSSITVSVGVLSNVSNSLVKSDNDCSNSLVDSSSLGIETETEEPGVTTASTNGDILSSLQSSEPDEMPLSLVSWYSEPGDCSSTAASHCCDHNNSLANSSKLSSTIGSELSEAVNNSVINSTSVTPTVNSQNDLFSEEKENKTPCALPLVPTSIGATENTNTTDQPPSSKDNKTTKYSKGTKAREQECLSKTVPVPRKASASQKQTASDFSKASSNKMHVQLLEQKSETNHHSNSATIGSSSVVELCKDGKGKLECPKCSRRSRSGTTTPATAAARSSSSRRVVSYRHNSNHQAAADNTSSKSNTSARELKKPIKSILKSESRSGGSGGSGSGSEKQSSMDSLGSNSGVNTMTRSDTGPRTKFYINNTNDSVSYPEDKVVSRLKQIEKYATVRISRKFKTTKAVSETETGSPSPSPLLGEQRQRRQSSGSGDSRSDNTGIPDLMTKSMSFLEKSSVPLSQQHRNAIVGSPGPSSLKRQGSLKLRKPSPGWEPGATRTSALRLLKMQENKARGSGGSGSYSMGYHPGTSGSTHSGSGESIQNPASRSIHYHHQSASRGSGVKERGNSSAKVFAKLSSASGQTASSSLKRLKQEKSVQTDEIVLGGGHTCSPSSFSVADSTSKMPNTIPHQNSSSKRDSPQTFSQEPIIFDASMTINALDQQSEQIKHLEMLVKRYKNSAIRFQHEFERTENKNIELKKQLQETQMESSEMLEFLQAEKSTLAESLVEVETECKKLTRELESVVKESQSRCSSLVRLSEQHKQEALKSQTVVHRIESHKNAIITQQRTQLTKGTEAIRGTKQTTLNLIENLMKTYKVSQERLATALEGQGAGLNNIAETELRCTLLVPLIKSLSKAFEGSNNSQQLKTSFNNASSNSTAATNNSSSTESTANNTNNTNCSIVTNSETSTSTTEPFGKLLATCSNNSSTSIPSQPNSTSSQNISHAAILEREKDEIIGLDSILGSCSTTTATTTSTCQTDADFLLREELEQLQVALRKLCTVIRIIVIHCDQKVSNVASNILQVLKSENDNENGNLDLDKIQKLAAKIS